MRERSSLGFHWIRHWVSHLSGFILKTMVQTYRIANGRKILDVPDAVADDGSLEKVGG